MHKFKEFLYSWNNNCNFVQSLQIFSEFCLEIEIDGVLQVHYVYKGN